MARIAREIPASLTAVFRGGRRSGYALEIGPGDPPSRIILSKSGKNYMPHGPQPEDEQVYEYEGRGVHGEAIYTAARPNRREN